MNLPSAFTAYTSRLFGDEIWQQYLESFNEPTPVSIRLNSGTSLEQLSHLPIESQVPWSSRGYYLSERPQFTLDPLLHAGAYYVQEASSQYLETILQTLKPSNPQTLNPQTSNPQNPNHQTLQPHSSSFWLDLCAAPGGKSLILKDHLPLGTTLISNEYIRKRAWILAENIRKAQPLSPVLITNNSPAEIADSGITFDLILCDVPCSGEGMFRKDHASIEEWSEENVHKCAALQRSIVESAWQCLNKGGILIYSTCTFNEYEDEGNAAFIQSELGGEIVFPARKFIPGRDRGEGQFMVAFRKNDGLSAYPSKKQDKKIAKALSRLNFLDIPQDLKGDDKTPECEISLEDSLNYLRGQSLVLPPEVPRGVIAVTYKGFRLGLMKNLGSRANNLYPNEWRIRHL